MKRTSRTAPPSWRLPPSRGVDVLGMRRPALPRYQTRISAPLIGSRAITPTLVLVYGAWHREWCWQPLIDHLQGIDVRTLELPSTGADADLLGDMHDDAHVVRRVVEDVDGAAVVWAHSY